MPFLKSVSLKKRKRKAMKRIKQIDKTKRVIVKKKKKNKTKKKSCHLVPKVVIDLSFEGRKVEGSRKYRKRESPKAGSRREETITEPINSCNGIPHNCGQMMPAVWKVAKPLEVEYRQPVHRSSDQSNSGRKEIEKSSCGEEIRESKV